MKRYTLNDAVEYVLANRRGKAFNGWTRQDIAESFIQSLQERAFLYTIDGRGQINGVVHGSTFPQDKVLHIHNILTTDKHSFRTMVERFKLMFSGWTLEATRHDKFKRYDTERFVKRLITTTTKD